MEGRVSKAHHYEFFALQRRGLAGENGQMLSNYFPHALGTGTIKKDMTKFFKKFATPCAQSDGLYF